MLTSTESIGTPGNFAKKEMHMFVGFDGPKPVPKLEEPTCCCGCGVGTASIIAMIIHALITWNIFAQLEESPKEHKSYYYGSLIFYGGMTLCYAGIAFCRTEKLCSIVSAINHLISIPIYLSALGLFLFAAYLLLVPTAEVSDKPQEQQLFEMIKAFGFQILLFIGVLFTLVGYFYTYMANKYQEFGVYLNKENKQ